MKTRFLLALCLLFLVSLGFAQTVQRIEAESFDEASGARSESNASLSGGGNVGYITNETWIKFSAHQFNEYDTRFDVAAAGTAGGEIEFRLDSPEGSLIGTATVTGTTGWGDYQIVSTNITQTIGTHDLYLVFVGGGGYLFNVDYFEKVTEDPNAVIVTLTTNVSPEEGGTIVSNIAGTDFAQGTEITLTANDNFGYNFLQWVDENGQTISSLNPVSFTIEENVTYMAQFEKVNTYTLTVNVEGANGLGDYSISPAGKDGAFEEYEEGTLVAITALENDIVKFNNWSTGETQLTTSVVMNQNVTLTGHYDNESFIAGWTMKEDRYAHPRVAELYASVDNRPELFVYDMADDALASNVRTNNRAGETGFSAWNNNRGAFFYFQTSFSTVGFQNINVKSGLLSYYYGCDEWTFQYSLDGQNFIDVSELITINGSSFTDVGGLLPSEAENQEKVYIRWTPNINGPIHGDAADVTATMLANVSVLADEVYVDDATAPVLVSSLPTNLATGVSASGNIVLTFDEKVQAGTGDVTLNGAVLTPEIVNKTVRYSYYGLAYNSDYTFSLPAGAITDLSGNAAEAQSIQFKTLEKPIPAKRGFDLIVDALATDEQVAAGTHVRTIADAFSAAPSNSNTRFLVFVTNGTYNLGGDGSSPQGIVLQLPTGKNNVSLIAQSKDKVIFTGNPAQGIKNAVLSIEANDLYMENITILHSDGIVNSGQKPALNPAGDRNVYNGVTLRSKQDTQVTGGNRSFYYQSTIEGDVDFICGGGTHWYESCNLNVVSGGYIVAPNHTEDVEFGYVFNNNTITASADYYLGRPWQNAPRAVYINTTMVKEPHTVGWTSMGTLPALFAEYNSVNGFGVPVNTDNRSNVFSVNGVDQTGNYNPVLTEQEAAVYTIQNVLGGDDNWNPMLIVEQIGAPQNLSAGENNTISWEENPYAICYVISRNGKFIGITTQLSFEDTLASTGTHEYTVQAANEYGGLSTASTVEMSTIGETIISTITYLNSIDGAAIENLSPLEYIQGNITTLPIPTLEGYTFYGWSTSATEPNTITEISASTTGDQMYYAFWGSNGNNQSNENTDQIDYEFTAAADGTWDNPANFNPTGQPATGENVSCKIQIETTDTPFEGNIIFTGDGKLRLRGVHTSNGTLTFRDGTSIFYYTSGAGMEINAPINVEGNLKCDMLSSIENESVMTLSGSIFGNGIVTPVNQGRGEVVNNGLLLLKGDNSNFTGTWDLTQNSASYPDMGYTTSVEGFEANAFGAGTINVALNNKVILSHERAAGSHLNVNISNNAKVVLTTVVNVQALTINGISLALGHYDSSTHPEFFEGNGQIQVTESYDDGSNTEAIPAFPGAEGHGKYVTGGRGGRVIYVTNLNDNGPGSLRDAINQSGPRIVVFKVSGTIKLESELGITSDITIAGQTAPGGGITLRDYPVKVRGNNVILRYLRFRMGDANDVEDDALGGRFQENILIDHCSMSWSTDECVSFYENSNFTLQWCIITESLTNSVHAKGAHGYGGIWGGLKASFHHNLLSHHSSRTPRFGEYGGRTVPLEGLVDMRNNVMYNWNGEGCYGGDAMNVNVVNNYYKPGPATADKRKERIVSTGRNMDPTSPMYDIWGRFYIDGNVVVGSERATEDNWEYGVYNQFHSSQGDVTDEDKSELRIDTPHNPGEITTHSALKAYDLVLEYAGARLYRDEVDQRAVNDTRSGEATIMDGGNGSTNGFIDTPSAAGGWPVLPTEEAPVDSDNDGMPDAWETENGLNPQNPVDANLKTVDGVYPNIEVYINSLVDGITNSQNGNLDVYVNPDDFLEKYNEAEDGSKFIMADGVYNVGAVAVKNHSYTFVPDENAHPVFSGNFYSESAEVFYGSFIFDGVDFDLSENTNAFLTFSNGASLASLEVKNAKIEGLKQSFLRTSGTEIEAPISKINFENCVIDGRLAESQSFIQTEGRVVQAIDVTQSTVFGLVNGQSLITLQNSSTADQVMEINFQNNTLYNIGTETSEGIINIGNVYSQDSSFSFQDNIVLDERGFETPIVWVHFSDENTAGTLTLTNNLVVDITAFSGASNMTVTETNALTLEGLGLISVGFPNPSVGNFEFTSSSPLATASSSGGVLGDPRWLVSDDVVMSPITYINSLNNEEILGLNPIEYIEGISYALPTATYEGYTFFSWSSNPDAPELITEIPTNATGERIYYAFWGEGGNNVSDAGVPLSYSIAYENLPTHAVNSNQNVIDVGVVYYLEPAKAPGYRFLGWFTEADYSNEVTMFDENHIENMTLFARWKKLGEFYAFPTVSKSFVTLKSSEASDTVYLVNALGITIKKLETFGEKTTISLRGLDSGTYFIKSSNTGKITRIVVN